MAFHDFPGAKPKFHDFLGFPGPVQTLWEDDLNSWANHRRITVYQIRITFDSQIKMRTLKKCKKVADHFSHHVWADFTLDGHFIAASILRVETNAKKWRKLS